VVIPLYSIMDRRFSRIYLSLLLGIMCLSCNEPDQASLRKSIVGVYYLDTLGDDDPYILPLLGTNKVQLIAKDDGSYYFEPDLKRLKGYEGTYYVEVFWETLGNMKVKCNNGETSLGFYFTLPYGDTTCVLSFLDSARYAEGIMKEQRDAGLQLRRKFVDTFYIDAKKSDDCIVDLIHTRGVQLILDEDGEFYFYPEIQQLTDYAGRWAVENKRNGIERVVLYCRNGDTLDHMNFSVHAGAGVKCSLCFMKENKIEQLNN
jgi:hypothetical protein